ncbi:MAG: hypothetical protein HMLIMOIP_002534 [Candidatus Nitrosomirales archaeon]|jgi:hypothetical protein
MDDPEGPLKGAEKITKKILADSKPPLRVVSLFIPEVNTETEMHAQLDIERNLHASFSNLQCSWLCPYDPELLDELELLIQNLDAQTPESFEQTMHQTPTC